MQHVRHICRVYKCILTEVTLALAILACEDVAAISFLTLDRT